ncbi:sensor histidine kinase [Hymenobacter sp. B81]|uniref:sensor histidine kinase n=1 Tax=Hymenobacter sp. B81 TaxID=3344878 RepID=UPI0037DC0E83
MTCLLLLERPPARAQSDARFIDSLRHRLATAPADTNRVQLLDELCWQLNKTDLAQARAYGEQGLRLARRLGDRRGELRCLNDLGTCCFYAGDYPAGLSYYLAAGRLARELGNRRIESFAYNGVANIHCERGELAAAQPNYETALRLAASPTDQALFASNLGNMLIRRRQFAAAERYTRQALTLYQQLRDQPSESRCYFNLALARFDQGQWRAARPWLLAALRIDRGLRSNCDVARDLNMLGSVLAELGQRPAALDTLRQALRYARRCGDLPQVVDSYDALAQVTERLGRYDQALAWQRRYQAAHDSIVSTEKEEAIAELQTRYRSAEQQARIARLHERNAAISQQARQQGWLLAGSALLLTLLAVVAGLLYNRNRLKSQAVLALHQRNEESRRREQDKETLLREMHHRVKNNLQVVSSLLSLQGRQLTDDGARAAITESRSRVDAMALLHQKLYQHEELRQIALADYVPLLVNSVLSTYGLPVTVATLAVDELAVDVEVALPLGLLLNELLTNACKYALADHPDPRLTVQLRRDNVHTLCLRVSDNGPGLLADAGSAGTSFGRRLIGLLAQQLDGELAWLPGPGTTAEVRVPLLSAPVTTSA